MLEVRLLSCSLFDYETLIRVHKSVTGQDVPYLSPTSRDPTQLIKIFTENPSYVRFRSKLTDLVHFTFLLESDSQSVRTVDDWSRTSNLFVAGSHSAYVILSGTLTQWYDTMLLMNGPTSPIRPIGNKLYEILISNPTVSQVFSSLKTVKYAEGYALCH